MKKDHVQNQMPKRGNKFQEMYRTESLTLINQMILQGYFLVKKILHLSHNGENIDPETRLILLC